MTNKAKPLDLQTDIEKAANSLKRTWIQKTNPQKKHKLRQKAMSPLKKRSLKKKSLRKKLN